MQADRHRSTQRICSLKAMTRTLLHVFPTFDVGGVQSRFVHLANHFGGRYRHLIVSMDGGWGAMQRLNSTVDATVTPVAVNKGKTWENLRGFRRVLRDIRPDLLVTSNWGSIEWAMANWDHRVPHLHMEDGWGPDETERQLLRRALTRRLVLSRSLVLFPGRKLLAVGRNIWKLPARACIYVPNGVDCARFGAPPDDGFAIQQGIARDRAVVGTVGVLRAEKNFVRLLEAFAKVRHALPAQLVIVGGGPLMEDLTRAATTLGIAADVVFTGATLAPERYLPHFSVFALSSDTEQMPLSILEAMAASRPIASTDVGDVPNMVTEENRPFIVPRDSTRLGEAILALLADREKAAAVGRANRERAVAVYDQSRMFAAYRRLFDGELTSTSGVS